MPFISVYQNVQYRVGLGLGELKKKKKTYSQENLGFSIFSATTAVLPDRASMDIFGSRAGTCVSVCRFDENDA